MPRNPDASWKLKSSQLYKEITKLKEDLESLRTQKETIENKVKSVSENYEEQRKFYNDRFQAEQSAREENLKKEVLQYDCDLKTIDDNVADITNQLKRDDPGNKTGSVLDKEVEKSGATQPPTRSMYTIVLKK